MSAPITGVRVVTDVNGQMTENVWLPMCDRCGCIVLGVDAHREACPPFQPPKPEPIAIDRHTWANIVHNHRTEGTYLGSAITTVHCACGKFSGQPFAHTQHVVAMLADHIEANR